MAAVVHILHCVLMLWSHAENHQHAVILEHLGWASFLHVHHTENREWVPTTSMCIM